MGRFAAAALAPGAAGRVLAVFERSFYVDMGGGRLACVGTGALGAGPLNALTAFPPPLPGLGDPMTVEDDGMWIGIGLRLVLAGARTWTPPPMPPGPPAPSEETAAALRQALDLAPATSLAAVVPHHLPPLWRGRAGVGGTAADSKAVDRIATAAAPGLAALDGWLRAGCPAAPAEAIAGLIGLGNGLTPSGDDVLAGALVALRAWGQGEIADRLARWLIPRTLGRTNDISRAHTAAAAAGEGHEHLHGLLIALHRGDREAVPGAAVRLGTMGHTSGWDALAGVAVALGVLGQAP